MIPGLPLPRLLVPVSASKASFALPVIWPVVATDLPLRKRRIAAGCSTGNEYWIETCARQIAGVPLAERIMVRSRQSGLTASQP
jgi:hypothetical protein